MTHCPISLYLIHKNSYKCPNKLYGLFNLIFAIGIDYYIGILLHFVNLSHSIWVTGLWIGMLLQSWLKINVFRYKSEPWLYSPNLLPMYYMFLFSFLFPNLPGKCCTNDIKPFNKMKSCKRLVFPELLLSTAGVRIEGRLRAENTRDSNN